MRQCLGDTIDKIVTFIYYDYIMTEIGIRELKSRLSYYVQLMQAGELVAIKVRNRVVGFLSNIRPDFKEEGRGRSRRIGKLQKLIERWKNEGILLSGGLCRPRPIQPVPLKGEVSSTDLLRQMRDEEE